MKEEITILNIIIIILKKIMKVIFNRKQKKNYSNIHYKNYRTTFFNIHKNKYKPNSKLKYTSGGSNSKNIKQFIIKEI